MVRLERLLANRGYCARSAARGFLAEHAVVAGGKRFDRGDARVDPAAVTIDGVAMDPETLLLAMNKPLGFTCSHREDAGSGGPSGPLVYELLPERYRRRDPAVSSVGRLDKDTTGLLLLTDDGALLHRLTSPKRHVPRVYLATLDKPLRGDEAALFAAGTMRFDDDDKPLLPATLEAVGERSARLTLYEGRYRQARRMFAAVGNLVVSLHRERFGPLAIELGPGAWRALSADEAALLAGPAAAT